MAIRGLATGAAGLFGIYVAVGYDVMSATNSSPQTTELFASDRADTLRKYVILGDVQLLGFGIFGSMLEGNLWPLFGSVTAGVLLHAMYQHALYAGQAKTAQQKGGGAQNWARAAWSPSPS